MVELNDHLLAKGFLNMWVINNKLVHARLNITSESIMCIATTFHLGGGSADAIWHVQTMHLLHLILEALLIEQLVPAFQHFENLHLLDPVIHLAIQELLYRLLHQQRSINLLYVIAIGRAAHQCEEVGAHHPELPLKGQIGDLVRPAFFLR